MRLFLCEKPDQAERLARVLGGASETRTHWETKGGWVTWAFGHLLRTCEPDELEPQKWGSPWRFEALPMLPAQLRFVPDAKKKDRVAEIGQLLKKCSEVLVATDGGAEGEMIGREILVHHRYQGPVSRVWLNALTPGAIQKALDNILPGEKTIRYYHAALARSEADWLIGMNGTRALTCRARGAGVVSIGRVQTPTVAIVVWRDREIAGFRSQNYFELAAQVRTESKAVVTLRHAPEEMILDRAKAQAVAGAARGVRGPLRVESEKAKRTKAPAPFDLNSLSQRTSKLWKWPAKKTLKIAQALYEEHTATTYPRTDCKYLTDDAAAEVPERTRQLLALPVFAALRGQTFAPGEWFNTKKVEGHDHDALRPTENIPDLARLNEDERKLYLLIATQYLASLMPPYVYDAVKVSMVIECLEFAASGTTPVALGWKVAFGASAKDAQDDDEDGAKAGDGEAKLPALQNGEAGCVEQCDVESKQTKPPKHYTEGTLLGAMMQASRFVTDPKLKRILNSEDEKQRGIGTVATRASVIEDIQSAGRGYVEATAKGELIATPKAHGLITLLEEKVPAFSNPGETALWQIELDRIKDGEIPPEQFTKAIRVQVSAAIAVLGQIDAKALGAALGVTEKTTGVRLPAYPEAPDQAEPELIDRGEFFSAAGWPGRFFKSIAGVDFNAVAVEELVRAGRSGIARQVPSKFKGSPPAQVRITFDATAKPYPKTNVEWPQKAGTTSAGLPSGVRAVWAKIEGEILDWGTYYTLPGVEAGGRDVHFQKIMARHKMTAPELAAILTAGKDGAKMDRKLFRNGSDQPFGGDPFVFYNPRRRPVPGLEFSFG